MLRSLSADRQAQQDKQDIMKYYIIAGEASGDLHGSNLIKEIKKLDNTSKFRAWGGDRMQLLGIKLVKHHKDLAFMGFIEVVKNLPTIIKNLKFCKSDILNFAPHALILIDYPGFNLRLVKWAKENKLKVIFYISPQVWAWKESRVSLIKNYVDKMIVILPFEKEFYKKFDVDVEYVGHPLLKVVEDYKQKSITDHTRLSTDNIIALLPGSRKQEIKRKLPVMLQTSLYFPDHKFIVAKAPGITDAYYDSFLSSCKNVTVSDQSYSILRDAKAALVTSGTATLETALFEVPQVVCYKAGEISYQIAKRLIKLKFISLVNLIMNKEVVKELIQKELTVNNTTHALQEILTNTEKQQQIKMDYKELKNLLSQGGDASANAAKIIFEMSGP